MLLEDGEPELDGEFIGTQRVKIAIKDVISGGLDLLQRCVDMIPSQGRGE
jgi:hypothetical protein